MKPLCVTIQMEAIELYFHVALLYGIFCKWNLRRLAHVNTENGSFLSSACTELNNLPSVALSRRITDGIMIRRSRFYSYSIVVIPRMIKRDIKKCTSFIFWIFSAKMQRSRVGL